MDPLEPNNNTNMNGHDSEHNHNLNIPPNGESSRIPQLNAAINGPGGTSSGRENIGEGGDADDDSDSASDGDYEAMRQGVYLNGNATDDEDETVDDGQEGVEDLEQDPYQPATPGCHCRCHLDDWTRRTGLISYSPPQCSGAPTPSSSVLAVRDGSSSSMESSVMWSSSSPVPSEHNYTVHLAWFDETIFRPVNPDRFSLVYRPLALCPESIFYYPPALDYQPENEQEE